MTSKLQLTNGGFALVDDDVYEELLKHSWRHLKTGTNTYVVRTTSIRMDGKRKGVTIYLHRQIMNAPSDKEVDHVDNDTFNCQRYSMRVVTRSVNQRNRRRKTNSESGIIGVYKYTTKRGERFDVKMSRNGKTIHVGQFDTLDAAIAAQRENAELDIPQKQNAKGVEAHKR